MTTLSRPAAVDMPREKTAALPTVRKSLIDSDCTAAQSPMPTNRVLVAASAMNADRQSPAHGTPTRRLSTASPAAAGKSPMPSLNHALVGVLTPGSETDRSRRTSQEPPETFAKDATVYRLPCSPVVAATTRPEKRPHRKLSSLAPDKPMVRDLTKKGNASPRRGSAAARVGAVALCNSSLALLPLWCGMQRNGWREEAPNATGGAFRVRV